jgi:hypothetical protein
MDGVSGAQGGTQGGLPHEGSRSLTGSSGGSGVCDEGSHAGLTDPEIGGGRGVEGVGGKDTDGLNLKDCAIALDVPELGACLKNSRL